MKWSMPHLIAEGTSLHMLRKIMIEKKDVEKITVQLNRHWRQYNYHQPTIVNDGYGTTDDGSVAMTQSIEIKWIQVFLGLIFDFSFYVLFACGVFHATLCFVTAGEGSHDALLKASFSMTRFRFILPLVRRYFCTHALLYAITS